MSAVVVTQATKEQVGLSFLHPSMFAAALYDYQLEDEIVGNPEAFGTFVDGTFGIESGVVISTGKVVTAMDKQAFDAGRPENAMQGTDFKANKGKTSGGKDYFDKASYAIQFHFDGVQPLIFKYVFASRELPEYGGSEYNDEFELAINGVNLANLQDGTHVTINHLVPAGGQKTPRDPSRDNADYIDNPTQQHFPYTGYTKLLTLTGNTVNSKVSGIKNKLNITIYDVADGAYDSAVFLEGGSLRVNSFFWTPNPSGASGCSATCGEGVTSQGYVCLDTAGNPGDASKCNSRSAKPADISTPCQTGVSCVSYRWGLTEWGACSVSCGDGVQVWQPSFAVHVEQSM